MKLATVACTALLAFSSVLHAETAAAPQSSTTTAKKPSYGKAYIETYEGNEKVDRKLTLMTKKLDLVPEQISRIKTVLDANADKMDGLNKEYADAKKRIADDTNGLILNILNPQQQVKYEKIRDQVLGTSSFEGNPYGGYRQRY